jgi:hypothetical protein
MGTPMIHHKNAFELVAAGAGTCRGRIRHDTLHLVGRTLHAT